MGTIRFDIPYPPTKKGKSAFCRRFGLNAYYSGKHWAQRKKDADELHAMTLASLKQARVRRGMVHGPVSITFAWDDGLDIDNHAAIAKAVWTRSRDTCCPTTITAGTGRSYIGFGTEDVFGWR